MYTLRCTPSLIDLLRTEGEPPLLNADPAPPDTLLGDWYADLLHPAGTAPSRILCVSALTLLPIVIPADEARLVSHRLADALGDLLGVMGVPRPRIEREQRQMRWNQFAVASDERVLRGLRQLVDAAKTDAQSGDAAQSALDLSVRLGALPVGPPHLGGGTPIGGARELFGLPFDPRAIREALAEDWLDGSSPD